MAAFSASSLERSELSTSLVLLALAEGAVLLLAVVAVVAVVVGCSCNGGNGARGTVAREKPSPPVIVIVVAVAVAVAEDVVDEATAPSGAAAAPFAGKETRVLEKISDADWLPAVAAIVAVDEEEEEGKKETVGIDSGREFRFTVLIVVVMPLANPGPRTIALPAGCCGCCCWAPSMGEK